MLRILVVKVDNIKEQQNNVNRETETLRKEKKNMLDQKHCYIIVESL